MRPNFEKVLGYFTYFTLNICFAMKKDEYSSPQIYDWIDRLLEVGFLVRYKNLHLFQLGLKYRIELEEKQFVFTKAQLWPALVLIFFGYLVALVTFIFEIFYCACKRFILNRKLKKI